MAYEISLTKFWWTMVNVTAPLPYHVFQNARTVQTNQDWNSVVSLYKCIWCSLLLNMPTRTCLEKWSGGSSFAPIHTIRKADGQIFTHRGSHRHCVMTVCNKVKCLTRKKKIHHYTTGVGWVRQNVWQHASCSQISSFYDPCEWCRQEHCTRWGIENM